MEMPTNFFFACHILHHVLTYVYFSKWRKKVLCKDEKMTLKVAQCVHKVFFIE